ncbi:MAG: glycosyltransferase [Candidatus Methanomethylicaceae archaeon]
MPELLLHFSIPFALTALRLGLMKAILISTLALLPDLDVLFHIHRSMSHSIIILILAYLPILIFVYKFKNFNLALIGLLALLTHLFLDSFQTYTPLLYPIIDKSIWFRIEGGLLISGLSIKPEFQAVIKDVPTVFKHFEVLDAPLFTSEGLSISLILIIPTLIFSLKSINSNSNQLHISNQLYNFTIEKVNSKDLKIDDVTIVLPTLNEEEAIGKVIDEIKAEGFKNILVVDGYSSDRTVEIAKSKGVEVIFQEGSGKAGAIRTALKRISTPYMLVMDADGTYNPRDIWTLLNNAHDYDEVIGFRINRKNIPFIHRIGNKIISIVFGLLMGKKIHDPCSGMYLLKTNLIKKLELTSSGFDVEVEIAGQIASLGDIIEVPISYRKRIGKGKLKTWREGFGIILAIIKVAWLYNPIFIFSTIASIMIFPGALILFHQLLLRYFYGEWSLGWSWLGLILLIIGLQGLTIATISLLLKRMERKILRKIIELEEK